MVTHLVGYTGIKTIGLAIIHGPAGGNITGTLESKCVAHIIISR